MLWSVTFWCRTFIMLRIVFITIILLWFVDFIVVKIISIVTVFVFIDLFSVYIVNAFILFMKVFCSRLITCLMFILISGIIVFCSHIVTVYGLATFVFVKLSHDYSRMLFLHYFSPMNCQEEWVEEPVQCYTFLTLISPPS